MGFQINNQTFSGYMARPSAGTGPGVLVLHAWWGLNEFFRGFCDRLAQAGFVALAPDLYQGVVVSQVDEAREQINKLNFEQAREVATAALAYLCQHSSGDKVGAVGFSMGGSWAIYLASLKPEDVKAVVIFYGSEGADFTASRAAYLGHFAEVDEWEPLEGVHQMEADMKAAGRDVTFHIYPHVGHWFFEANRPDVYHQETAQLAWERTLTFLQAQLG